MPSPFPGMDPFLENPATWPDFHHDLISEIKAVLTRDLRPRYYARVEQRVYVSDEDDPGRRVIVPDARVIEGEQGARRQALHTPGTLAVIEPIIVTTMMDEEIREPFIELRDQETRRVVTVIEVVSPTNKVRGGRGRDDFLRKRSEVMHSDSHWVEIDLLREGEPAVPRVLVKAGDYFVHVSRVEERPKGRLWLICLSQVLPTVRIPLLRGDDDAPLNLQELVSAVYDRSGYDLDIDYKPDPTPPLEKNDAAWADELRR